MLATVFAAAVHDVDHPGVTSQYIINTGQSVSRRSALRPVRLSHARGSKMVNFRAVVTMEE